MLIFWLHACTVNCDEGNVWPVLSLADYGALQGNICFGELEVYLALLIWAFSEIYACYGVKNKCAGVAGALDHKFHVTFSYNVTGL